MGHVPDWMRGNMKKTGAAPAKPGIVSRPIFHGEKAVAKLADGGTPFDYDNPGKIVGEYQSAEELKGYSGNDEIVKARLGMKDNPAPKYESIEQLLEGAGPAQAEAKPVEPPRDTTAKPAPRKTAAPKAPKMSGETIGPQVTRMNKTADAEIMHDESKGNYEQLRNSKASKPKLFYKK